MPNKNKVPLLEKIIKDGTLDLIKNENINRWKGNPIKILAWGGSPYVITGFGIVARKVFSNLYRSHPGKYDISMVAINHNGDFYEESEITGGIQNGRFRMWPALHPNAPKHFTYGQMKFLQLMDSSPLDFDFIYLFEDPFWVGGLIPGTNPPALFVDEIKKRLNAKGKGHIPIVCYFPIDGIPKREWIQTIAKCDLPITYLKFGAELCLKAVPELSGRLSIIPHGIDPSDFYPIKEEEKRAFKRAMFGDQAVDKFMFINVNRNQLRKLVPSSLLAFKAFQEKTNNAGFIYLNMRAVDVGWNLMECCRTIGLTPGIDVFFPPNFSVQKGLTQQELNNAFSSADALISTAVGGGWELSVTQAFATKTAVIAPHNTSHIELLGDQNNIDTQRGLLYKSGSNLAQTIIFPSDNEVPRPLPDLDDMVSKMLYLFNNRDIKLKLEENAYNWVINNILWDRDVTPKFDLIFSQAKKIKDQREEHIFNIQNASTTINKSVEIEIPKGQEI